MKHTLLLALMLAPFYFYSVDDDEISRHNTNVWRTLETINLPAPSGDNAKILPSQLIALKFASDSASMSAHNQMIYKRRKLS